MKMTKFNKSNSTKLQLFLQKFNDLTKHPENFLNQHKESGNIKTFLQNLYDYINSQNKESISDILPKLVIDDLDEEQIWQQIEIKNDSLWLKCLKTSSELLSTTAENLQIKYKCVNDSDNSDNKTDNDEENSFIESNNNINSDEESDENLANDDLNINKVTKKNIKTTKPSIVDDKFFKLSELEAFLNSEDKKEMLKTKKSQKQIIDNEEIDYFAFDSTEEDDSNENVNYKDFFENDDKEINVQNKRINNNSKDNISNDDKFECNENIEDNETNLDKLSTDIESDYNDNYSDSNDEDPKSSHEQRQERLRQRIEEYEEKALSEKPWQLKGEISATLRPHNSLLEDILEYDSSTRPAPIITEEFNQSIEDIIRQRIKDKSWDDVVRIEKPVATPQELRKKLILDSEKSKESLAKIYEKEYQKEIEKLSPINDTEKSNPLHKEIKEMMASLFKTLDALSNFHFTPKPVVPEPKIITNTPVINMEEVAPLSLSDAKLLAPEEIKQRSKGNVLGETERTKTDKARERRHKKLRQKSIFKAQEIKDSKIQNKKFNTQKIQNNKLLKDVIKSQNVSQINGINGNSVKNSKSFFSQLQDKTVTNELKRKPLTKINKHGISVKKLKL